MLNGISNFQIPTNLFVTVCFAVHWVVPPKVSQGNRDLQQRDSLHCTELLLPGNYYYIFETNCITKRLILIYVNFFNIYEYIY